MAIYQLGDDVPRIAASAWVADSAQVIGRVELADKASVWFGVVARGDIVVVDEETSRLGVSLTEIVGAPQRQDGVGGAA